MNTKIMIAIYLSFLLIFYNCNKSIDGPDSKSKDPILKTSINGYIQKGPFINGSSITLYELNDSLFATGKIYESQIRDNLGSFEFNNVKLISNYSKMKAEGFYFNEIKGENSIAQLTMYAFSDLSDFDSINVNILSHLEKNRVEYLISAGKSFSEAKDQAKKEILKLFQIDKLNIADFEILDISKDSDDNAILLAVSVILQGYRNTANMSELLANIDNDIREDGKLDNQIYGSMLLDDAMLLDLAAVRENIENRYKSLGENAIIPNFEFYVNHFIDNTPYQPTKSIEYPATTVYGENILDTLKVNFLSGNNYHYSFAANLPQGFSLQIIMKYLSGAHPGNPLEGIERAHWEYVVLPDPPLNWEIAKYNFSTHSQSFNADAPDSDVSFDLKMSFAYTGEQNTYIIEYYNNNSVEPTRIKVITVD